MPAGVFSGIRRPQNSKRHDGRRGDNHKRRGDKHQDKRNPCENISASYKLARYLRYDTGSTTESGFVPSEVIRAEVRLTLQELVNVTSADKERFEHRLVGGKDYYRAMRKGKGDRSLGPDPSDWEGYKPRQDMSYGNHDKSNDLTSSDQNSILTSDQKLDMSLDDHMNGNYSTARSNQATSSNEHPSMDEPLSNYTHGRFQTSEYGAPHDGGIIPEEANISDVNNESIGMNGESEQVAHLDSEGGQEMNNDELDFEQTVLQ